MAIRRSHLTSLKLSKSRRKRLLRTQRLERRGLQMERLEDRRLLAGIELAGISTNEGILLHDGDVLNEAPRELKVRFSEEASLDLASLAAGIEVVRSGQDGVFESASVTTDLNTVGAVLMKFTAVQPGVAGEGIVLEFTKSDRGAPGNIGISVEGDRIRVDLNNNSAANSTATDVLNAVNVHPEASRLVVASIAQGNAFGNVAAPAISYSPLTMIGANQARATSSFGQGTALLVEFIAVPTGIDGNGITIGFTQRDFGGPGGPLVSVQDGKVQVELNTNLSNPTTAQGLVAAVNTDPQVSQLVATRVVAGGGATPIGTGLSLPDLVLQGASDVVVTPGFLGLGETDNIAVFRFAETLPDDVYQINILGQSGFGRTPITDVDGNIFLDGMANYSQSFELDLGARVLSVVPQPLRRQANGQLLQARNEVEVYFNNDDLERSSAENVNFYQLILTQDTARNTDDVRFNPVTVSYDPHADRAVLTFADDLATLAGGDGTFRLRIGTANAMPLAPQILNSLVDAGATFTAAMDINVNFDTGPVLAVRGGGSEFVDGQTITIFNNQGAAKTLEFEDSVSGPQGITTGNEPIFFSTSLTPAAMTQLISNAIINANIGILSIVDGQNIFLTGDALVTLDPTVTGVAKASQGTIISAEITNDGQPFEIDLPGSSDEPGHRDIPVQDHIIGVADSLVGVTDISYNFQENYGKDTEDRVLRNAITEVQKERVRQIFEIFGEYFGIDFVETQFRGLTVAVGDVRAVNPVAPTGPNGLDGISSGGPNIGIAVLSAQQFDNQNDEFGGAFFQAAMREVGELLGLGSTNELPPLTISGSDPSQAFGIPVEPIFPGDADIVHGQFLHRPEVKDIDLYTFEVSVAGLFTAETIAERLLVPSQLDTVLNLYRQNIGGDREVIARNDDYFSSDSFLELELQPGTYFIGVSASGNDAYNPEIADSGFGGTSEGIYDLRLNLRGETDTTIIDADNLNDAATGAVSAITPFDGDADGTAGGEFNFWFRTQTATDTLIVDKAAGSSAPNGSLAQPFTDIGTALTQAQPGDIVRIVGNGGADGDVTTLDDNLAYEVGFSDLGGQVLADGSSFEIPQGVTVMVDSGAIIKFRRAHIGVGSSTTAIDRSGGALQILGTPRLVDESGNVVIDVQGQPVPGDVILTSLHDTIGIDTNPDTTPPDPAAADWGGIVFRANLDHADESRFSYENAGIFLNYVGNTRMQFGGGNVVIDGEPTLVAPIFIADSRPTIAYNTIQNSAHAAISANPDSFLETTFHENNYQFGGAFTSDYSRSGPDIDGNRLIDNTINGVFIRIDTLAGNDLERLNVPGRFDDTDIVHVLQENLVVNGQPGGPVLDSFAPPAQLIDPQPGPVGGILQPGTYNYRITFVDETNAETPASNPSVTITVPGNPDSLNQLNIGQVIVNNLPTTLNFEGFIARRLYRSTPGGIGPYILVAEINGTSTTFIDNGTVAGGELDEADERLRARPDARLRIDPGTIIKSENAVIELMMGADLFAEGKDGHQIVFTSLGDVRYGAGGDFDTNNQGAAVQASRGDWAGIYAGYLSRLSLDHTIVAYAGGEARLEGGFRTFNPIEIHRADARIANSVIELSASGFNPIDGNDNSLESRFGRGYNRPAAIFVRGSQPAIVDNIIRDNPLSPAISVDVNSLNHVLVDDSGRSTDGIDLYEEEFGNQGPLLSGNRLIHNNVNALVVRAGTLTTEGVWDDTDIVHFVTETISVPDHHTYGALRLESKSTESLVVKLDGSTAGFAAYGNPLDINDRIGGAIHIIGQPGFPVVLTSFQDDSVGAGLQPDGSPQTDTNNNAVTGDGFLPTGPEVDNGTVIDNDVPLIVPGFFQAQPIAGGSLDIFGGGMSGVTFFGTSGLLPDLDVIFQYLNMIDPEGDGSAVALDTTTITQPPTLIGEDVVFSAGTFAGVNGEVTWEVETYFEDGIPTLFNQIKLTSDSPLGDIQFVNYLDEDVFFPSDDFLYLVGTPGDADFRAFTIDDLERIGFSQGGVYLPSPDLVNATYTGFAADQYADLLTDIQTTAVPFTVAGTIDTVALPPFNDPDLGQLFGLNDVTTAFAWNVDPLATTATITTFLELVPRNPSIVLGTPGDWDGVLLNSFSHDRNVDVYTELEPYNFDTPGTNTVPAQAEFLGRLAESANAGDEELRLGYQIHGAVSSPGDVDVYSFKAHGRTEVWFDIDDTSRSLDTVVELIAADGTLLARSDNSAAENDDSSLLFRGNGLPANHVNSLKKSDFSIEDNYSVNVSDAGMRVVLPGDLDAENLYFVRVRSSSSNLNDLRGGTSQGAYQLQIRLQEQDEAPGSVIRYADIRFATNGIQVIGQPIHSPLVGETGDIDDLAAGTNNDTVFNGTNLVGQDVGNVFDTDRAALSIAGVLNDLGNVTDVDSYTFQLEFQLTDPGLNPGATNFVPLTIDVDYADGLERPDTIVSVYDANGNLLFLGNDSNLAEDLPAALHGNDFDDLTRGSVNTNDAFIGPITLPEGQYNVAVTAVTNVPQELGQFFQADPLDPLFRLEPINSLKRIAEERFAAPPDADNVQVPVLFDNQSILPWSLGDVTLYVSQSAESGQPKTSLSSVNPFTGQLKSRVGSFSFDSGDIALRPNGELRASTQNFTFGVTDATSGEYLLVDPATGNATVTGWTTILTNERDLPLNPTTARATDDGIHFDAMTFGALADEFTELGFGVGRRAPGSNAFADYSENILYQFEPDTGIAFSRPANDRPQPPLYTGAGTQIIERGFLDTLVDSSGLRGLRIISQEPTAINEDNSVTWNVLDGDTFTVDNGSQVFVFEMVSGPEIQLTLDPTAGAFLHDGDTFFLDQGQGQGPQPFEFDTGEVLIIDATFGGDLTDGDRFSVADNQVLPIIRTFEFDDGTGAPLANGITQIPFNVGMSRDEIVVAVVDAINSQTQLDAIGNPIFATSAVAMPTVDPLFSNRISLINSNSATENADGLVIEGNTGRNTIRLIPNAPGTPLIKIEEVFTNAELVDALKLAFNGVLAPPVIAGIPGITAGAKGDRANFVGMETGDFSEMVDRGAAVDLMHDSNPVSLFTTPVSFLADDTREVMANRIVDAINANPPLQAVTAENERVAQLVNAVFDPAGTTLRLGGGGPGGIVTGIAVQNNRVWAVSDNGGFYEVLAPTTPLGASVFYIEGAVDLVGIEFSGLTAPPRNVDGEAYRDDLLFAIDKGGRMHAFDLQGQLQTVFADGKSSAQVFDANGVPLSFNGQGDVTGLTFSNLDYNLWHVTNTRAGDAGHEGGSSLQFGFESTGQNNVPADEAIFDPNRPFVDYNSGAIVTRPGTYDFPGGSHGEIISNEFDLSGYVPDDQPTLYFNYFLATENTNSSTLMRDAFRVFATSNDGVKDGEDDDVDARIDGDWQLLGTNNSAGETALADGVVDLFDNGDGNALSSWRQARIDLSDFAGQSNIRLRFEFSTDASFDVGNIDGLGERLYTIPGAQLRDAQVVTIDGVEFEVDLGVTLVTPSGRSIIDGESFTLHGQAFEFDRNGSVQSGNTAIPVADNQSPKSVATTITSVLQNAQYMKTANLTVETVGNDTIGTAVATGLTGGADMFVADGEIGDNPNLIIQGLDVDMVHLNLNAGDSIQVTARPHIDTPLFDPLVRIFDVAGNELAVNDNAMGLTAQTGVSVNLPGTYYVAVSASPNDNYDSVVEGFGTVGATTGMYELEIMVNGFGGVVPRQVGSRVQLDGAVKISQSANSSIVLDGQAGVERGRVAFDVHANMTSAEVSQVVQQVLADEFAGGYLLAFPYHEQYVRISRHDIVERGPFGLDEELPTDAFGSFHGPGALGAADNRHEGVYIDDIIIGFAERGEMVVGGGLAPADRGQFVNNTTAPPNPVVLGEYQLELRRAQEFVEPSEDDLTSFVLVDSFDTNDRVSQEHSLVAPSASDVVDGQIFTISDGVDTVTFEFEDVSLGNGIQPGRQEISFNPSADDGRGGLTAEGQSTMARRIRDAINSTQVQAVLDVTAAMSDGEVNGEESTSAIVNLFGTVVIGQPANITDVQIDLSFVSEPNDTQSGAVDTNLPAGQNSHVVGSGQIGDNPLLGGFNAPLDVDIVRFDLQAGSEATFRIHAAATGSDLDSTLRLFDESGNELAINDNIDLFNLDSEIVFTATSSGTYFLGISATGNETYTIDSLASGKVGLTTGEYELEVDVVSAGVGFLRFDAVGDENVVRDQGQVIISSSQISHSLEFGVVVDAGARDPLNAPHPGVARHLSQINSERLVPGAVIKNNIIAFNQLGGISFSGQTTAPGQPDAVVPFGRIVNNTLYGVGGSLSLPQSLDVGINISDNASPTLLNNIFANFNAGIAVDASSASTVIGGSVYQGNNDDSTVGLGARPIQLSDVAPLFLDALNGNFYPAPGSQVIDSSMESLEDRLSMVSVRGPLGIPVSPIIAPEFDVLGQLRADDPLVEGGNGAGQNVFIDRGAVDRSDFAGPTAFLIEPRDNDSNGVDQDPQLTVVDLTAQSLEAFAIQLVDGVEPVDPANGVGVDDRSIRTEQVKVFQDSILLVDGVDYRFRYDSLNNTIRIIPLAGVWESNHTYRIQIANDDQFLIVAPAGDEVSDGQAFTMVDNDSNFARFEYESGYVLTVPETFVLNMPRTGGGLGGVTDRENFALNGTTFEFDNNGSVAAGSETIVFTPTDNADVLAQAVVDAILLADIGLAPKFIGDGAIHLGTQLTDVVSLINAPSLSSRGTVGGGLRDGDTIRIDDGSVDQVFQIGIGGIGGGGIGTTVISILQSDTYEEVADKVVAGITAATNLTPTHLGTGVIQVGGSLRTVIDASGSQMTQAGQPGVAASFGILIPTIAGVPQNISDGDTFQVGDGVGLPITFEFDSDNVVVPGNTVVRIPSNNPTMDRIANALVQAIASVGLGVSPVNVGDGRVELQNASVSHLFNPLTSSLTQLGSPGVDGSLPVPFVPADTFTSINMAVVIESAINASKLIVDATRVDDQITLEGISNVAGVVESFVQGVRDLAGNLLKPNQPLDTTEFTILLGSGLDYGDAPVTYDTLTVDGGPSHTVIPGYGLGAELDVDVDGQPNATATGDDTVGVDDEDGVVFGTTIRGFDGTVTVTTMGVTAAQQGRLDAWIDFNHDGDFVDAGEQVFTSEVLADGLNILTYAIPSAATVGDTFARFRLSSTGGLTPFGTAIDGEVEDLGVTINSSPWQNGIKIADVTGDGRVQPLDVLHIVSFLSRFGPQNLPVPPPFIGSGGEQIFADQRMIDVDGNGRVQVLDAALVVNAIFLQNQGGGEGESTYAAAALPPIDVMPNRPVSSDEPATAELATAYEVEFSVTMPTAENELDTDFDAALVTELAEDQEPLLAGDAHDSVFDAWE